MDNILDFLLD